MHLQETLKSVIAQYNASQLLTMREVMHMPGCAIRCSATCSSHSAEVTDIEVAFVGVQVVSRDIRTLLTQRAKYFNIVLDDVSITNLTFSREYTGAVEAKQVAQQESERAKFIVSSLWAFCILSSSVTRSCVYRARAGIYLCRSATHATRYLSGRCVLSQVEKAEQEKQTAIVRAQGEVSGPAPCPSA
jgi:regulator of protease activity HflC (stomatin/prohibitin superfamily)